jgi:lysophospholipase L1-like esterase
MGISMLDKNSDYIIISIGGNDLREIQSLKDVEKEQAFRMRQDNFVAGIKEIMQRIRDTNNNSVVVVVGNYNPTDIDISTDNVRYINNWSYNTQLIVDTDIRAVFVPTYNIFKYNLDRYIAPDKLHPNTVGYQTISYLISKTIENTLNEK